jgi:citrate synthase
MGRRLAKKTGRERLHDLSKQIEKSSLEAFKARGKTTLQPNVDFYSAPVYHMMGIPGDLMTPIFAMARVAGWCAHIIEEKFAEAQGKPALYRPRAEYVGQYCGLIGCTYEPLEGRR